MAASPSAPPASADAPGTPGHPCPKCGTTEPWGFASWCPKCGYYPKLGTSVQMPEGPKEGVAATGEGKPIDWMTLVAPWAWLMLAGCVLIAGATIGASRLLLAEDSTARVVWTVIQALAGGLLAFLGQLLAYLHACAKTDKFGPMDMFMKPFEIWKATIARLPWGAYRLDFLAWGLTMALSALVFVGGIDYMGLFEPEGSAKKKKAPNVVHQVVDQAKKSTDEEGAGSIEDAMKEFTGDGEGDGDPKDEEEKREALKKGPTLDCVIFGYTVEDGSLALLLLAAVTKGDAAPRFVATITAEDLPDDVRRRLVNRLPSLERAQPIARTSLKARWLQPKMMCRVAHKGFTRDRRLKNASFLEMLDDVEKQRASKPAAPPPTGPRPEFPTGL